MHESRWALSGVPEVPLIPQVARVAVVDGVVPVVVTTVIVAEVEAVAVVMSTSSFTDRSAKSSPLGLGIAIAMGSWVSILSVFPIGVDERCEVVFILLLVN